jgi:hypothetical protein
MERQLDLEILPRTAPEEGLRSSGRLLCLYRDDVQSPGGVRRASKICVGAF